VLDLEGETVTVCEEEVDALRDMVTDMDCVTDVEPTAEVEGEAVIDELFVTTEGEGLTVELREALEV
jgi:hypothetical protein